MSTGCENLRALIDSPTTNRTDIAYEAVFDEFIYTLGGRKLDSEKAPARRSADYFVRLGTVSAIIELKQLFEQTSSLFDVATLLLTQGKISSGLIYDAAGGVAGLTPKTLTDRDRYRLYARWGRILDDKLKEANRQIKSASHSLLSEGPSVKGVVILNTGNYQFTTSRISNVAGVFLHKQWGRNHYNHIDFAVGLSVDLFKEGGNPLSGAAIARPTKKETCSSFLHEFLKSWTSYLSCGFEKSFSFAVEYTKDPIVDDVPYKGKVQRTPN